MDQHSNGLGSFLPVLPAYRADLEQRAPSEGLSEHEGEWLLIGTLLERASYTPDAERRGVFAVVRNELRGVLGPTQWERGPSLDASPPMDDDALGPRVRLLCEQVEDSGATHLADAILNAYLRSGDALTPLEHGRFEALRGRVAWKRGDHATAAEHYQRVKQFARQIASPELEVRATVGHAVLARLRGNYPVSRRAARRAVKLGEAHGLGPLAALGHQSLMIGAVVSGDLNLALHHSWLAYAQVQGDPIAEAGHLADTAQLFLDAGHVEIALDGFVAALKRAIPHRVRLPALGGAALAAARLGDARLVLNFAAELEAEVADAGLPYASAVGRLEIAEALRLVGHDAAAEPFLRAAETVADDHRYHELAHRARLLRTATTSTVAVQPLTSATREIGAAVRALAGASV